MSSTPWSDPASADPMQEGTARLGNSLDAPISQNPARAHEPPAEGCCVGSVALPHACAPEPQSTGLRMNGPFPLSAKPVTCDDGTSANDLLRADPLREDLSQLAAAHRLGGWANAVDDLAKPVGDGMFVEVLQTASAVARMLGGLGLDTGAHPLAAETWREAGR